MIRISGGELITIVGGESYLLFACDIKGHVIALVVLVVSYLVPIFFKIHCHLYGYLLTQSIFNTYLGRP